MRFLVFVTAKIRNHKNVFYKMTATLSNVFEVLPQVAKDAHIEGLSTYQKLYEKSIRDPVGFWGDAGRQHLTWFKEFDTVLQGGFEHGDISWFLNGKLNVSTNCIDRHIPKNGNKVAIIWEADEPGHSRKITYLELLRETCKVANAMKQSGVKKGDNVVLYMPMVPEIVFTMLACARIGAPHIVVFAGFSHGALRDRIVDARSKWVFTTDEGKRGGRTLSLKETVDTAVEGIDFVSKVFVFPRTSNPNVKYFAERDVQMQELASQQRPYCPAEWMDSEDNLFTLYTSGSTGSPKGLVHSTAGYLLYTMMTTKYVFDLKENDVYACVADCGWITGHSYIVYGPLANGTTTLLFESTPTYPDDGRYWDLIQRHKVTQFYTAPTAIRLLMGRGDHHVTKYDRSSLRILGSVGEPINPEAWRWYYNVVGNQKCMIMDTYWQTETGGHVGTGLPGVTSMKPGSCSFPFFGIEFCIKDSEGNNVPKGVEGRLCLTKPWPGIARTVLGDHERYMKVYFKTYPGYFFTGDGCRCDEDGYYWITGRVDDVLTTSGHRIGTAEIESALVAHPLVSEAAVIGFPHKIKGEGICCYVTLRTGIEETIETSQELRKQIRKLIGAFATPDVIVCTSAMPKTRSGKIMRRILRKITAGEEEFLGDISTLADESVVQILIDQVKPIMEKFK